MGTQSPTNGVQNRIESYPNRMDSSRSDQKLYKANTAHEPTAGVNKKTVDKPNTDNVNPKYRDLRQLENKLKKWENVLKLRASKIDDSANETRRLQDYIQKLEARNHELETTIKTLQCKINLLETEQVIPEGCPKMPMTVISDTDQLILGVREQVTKYVMGKVTRQLTNMELMESSDVMSPDSESLDRTRLPPSDSHTTVLPRTNT